MNTGIKPGLHDLTDDQYHSDPCPVPSLSSSLGKKLINRTPRHAWSDHPRLNPRWQAKHRSKFDLGDAAHALVLGGPARFEVVDAASWRGKAAANAKETAYEQGKIPILIDQYENTVEMAAACHAQLEQHEEAAEAYTDGVPEQTLIWQENGIWCRSKLDWLPNSARVTPKPRYLEFYDYKSTGASANPETFNRTLFDLGYDFQAAFYRRGIRAVLGISDPIFKFVVQENYHPYALSVIGLPQEYIDEADADVDSALRTWSWCLEHDKWPGYSGKTYYVDAPPWHRVKREDRQVRESMANEGRGKTGVYRQMMDWQAPLDQVGGPT